MNLVLTGIQASGKGTQARLLAAAYNLTHLEPGKLFREEAQKDTKLAERIRESINQGYLVPDEILFEVVSQHLERSGWRGGLVCDGVPRNLQQKELLERFFDSKRTQIDAAIHLSIDEETSLHRLAHRVVYLPTGRTYNLLTDPPPSEVLADKNNLQQRHDETPDAIRNRLAIYHRETEPLLDVYRNQNILIEVDGRKPIHEVFESIVIELRRRNILSI